MQTSDYGTIQIRAYSASEALPVVDASVKISSAGESNRDLQFSLLTDIDGLTKELMLPAPSARLSMSPGASSLPYSEFDIEIVKDGYYPKKILNVPIFAGTRAILPIEMLPLSYQDDGSVIPLKNLNSIIYENEKLN